MIDQKGVYSKVIHDYLQKSKVGAWLTLFTAPASQTSGMKSAHTDLQTVYFPVLVSQIYFR